MWGETSASSLVKVCAEPGCPVLTNSTRCAEHERAKDRARGTRRERGYGALHEAERAQWAPLVTSGGVKCWRCNENIRSDEPWDMGHDDRVNDPTAYRGPEHVRCNRATAGRR